MKLALKSLFIITCLVLMFSCGETPTQKTFNSLSSDTAYSQITNKKIIPVEQGVTMYNEFQETRTMPLNPILKNTYRDSAFVDTKFVHFSLKDLKDYLTFLEHVQELNPKKDISGLRIYFSAYPNAKTINGRSVKHPRQQTVFMAPTVNIGQVDKDYNNLNNVPFYIEGSPEQPYKGDFVFIEDLMLDYKKEERIKTGNRLLKQQRASFGINLSSMLALPLQKTKTSLLLNEGEMSPPPLGD